MNKGINGQENKHLTVREMIEFINREKCSSEAETKSASVIFHIVNCEQCREIYDSILEADERFSGLFDGLEPDDIDNATWETDFIERFLSVSEEDGNEQGEELL